MVALFLAFALAGPVLHWDRELDPPAATDGIDTLLLGALGVGAPPAGTVDVRGSPPPRPAYALGPRAAVDRAALHDAAVRELVRFFEEAGELDPYSGCGPSDPRRVVPLLWRLASAATEAGRHQQATEALRRIAAADPDGLDAVAAMEAEIGVHLRAGDYEAALHAVDRVEEWLAAHPESGSLDFDADRTLKRILVRAAAQAHLLARRSDDPRDAAHALSVYAALDAVAPIPPGHPLARTRADLVSASSRTR